MKELGLISSREQDGTTSSFKRSFLRDFLQDLVDLKEMAYREFQLLTRYKTSLISGMLQVVLIYTIIILGMVAFIDSSTGSTASLSRFSGTVFYSMTIFLLFSDALWVIGYSVNEKQLTGVLESHFLAPTRYWILLIAPILTNMIWTLSASALSFVIISLTIGTIPTENIVLGVLVLIFTYGIIFGISSTIAALAVHMKQGTTLVINFLQIGLLIVCAMGFPFSVLPESVLMLSRMIPLSYGVDLFRNVMSGMIEATELMSWTMELPIVVFSGIILPAIGIRLFSFSINKAKEKGTLASF